MENQPQTTAERTLPFLDHLEEIRFRLFRVVISFIILTGLAYFFKERIFEVLTAPLADLDVHFIHTKVYDKFLAYMKISLYTGIVLSFPIIIFQLSRFVVPALYPNERKWYYTGLVFVVVFFFLGAFVSYRYLTPVSLQFLIEFGNEEKKEGKKNVKKEVKERTVQNQLQNINDRLTKLNNEIQSAVKKLPSGTPEIQRLARTLIVSNEIIKDLSTLYKDLQPRSPPGTIEKINPVKDRKIESYLSISDYFDWIIFFVFIIGVIFQLPLVISILAKVGVVDDRTLGKVRPYALIAILVLSAIITPPDVLSQLMVGLPVYLLYEISIIMARIIRKRNERNAEEEAN